MKDKLPKIGLLIGSLVLFVFISEILLVFAGFNYYPVDIDVNISEKDRIFRLNKTSGYYETAEEKLIQHTPEEDIQYKLEYQKFKAEKEPGTYRIFVLGGSSVYILANNVSYLEYAKDRFETLYPDKKPEIVFVGLGASGTSILFPVLQELLEYKPDLIILYSGHNEFIDDTMKYYLENRGILFEINEKLEKLRIYQFLSKITAFSKNILAVENEIEFLEGISDFQVINQTQRQIVHDNYRLNIENMIRTAKNKNVDFMVSAVAYNHMSPPIYGVILRGVLSYENLSMYDLIEITINFSREHEEKMISICDTAINQGKISREIVIEAVKEYRQGLKYYLEGHFDKAKEHFEMAILLEYFPQRANNITNKIVRELSKEYDIPLADVELAMLEETEHNITTYEQFNDHCHLKSEGNEILLDTFLKTIKENNLVE